MSVSSARPELVEARQDPTHAMVDVADERVVVLLDDTPLRVGNRQTGPRVGEVLALGAYRQRHVVRVVEVEKARRRIERCVRRVEAGDRKERLALLRPARARAEVVAGDVGDEGRVGELLGSVEDVRLVRVARVDAYRRTGPGGRRVDAAPLDGRPVVLRDPRDVRVVVAARLVADDARVEAESRVRLAMVAEGRGVIEEVELAELRRVVAVAGEHVVDALDARGHLHAVRPHAQRPRVAPREHALPARHADGAVRVRVVEDGPGRREGVEVRRLHERMPARANRVPSLLICLDDQDIRALHGGIADAHVRFLGTSRRRACRI